MVKKTVTTTEEVDLEDAPKPEAETIDDDTIRALTEIEGADEIRWQVHRLNQPDPGYCGELSTSELSLQRIADEYGSGRYRLKGITAQGKYYKSGTVTITRSVAKPDSGAQTATMIADALKNKSGDAMMPLLLSMIQSNGQIVAAALAKPSEPKKDFPWSAVIAAAPVTLTALKEFFKNDTDSQSMEKLLKQLTILEKLRGTDKDSGGTSWPDIIRDGLSTLRGMAPSTGAAHGAVQTRVAQPISASVVGSAHGSLPDSISVETPVAIEPTSENLTMDWLRKKLDELLQNAAQNKNPELRAELLLDDLPVFIPESLIKDMLSRSDWFEQLCAFDQRALNYHGWLNELRDCVLNILDPDGNNHEQTESSGDERSTEADGGTS